MDGLRGIFADPYLTLLAIGLGLGFLTVFAALLLPRIPVGALGEVWKLFLGVEVPPALVGWVRALTTAWVSAAIVKLGAWAGVATDPVILTGLVLSVVGSLWGLLDQARKRTMNDSPPAPGTSPIAPERQA